MTPTPIPELPHTCNSWVVTSPDGGRRCELWTRANVEKAALLSLASCAACVNASSVRKI